MSNINGGQRRTSFFFLVRILWLLYNIVIQHFSAQKYSTASNFVRNAIDINALARAGWLFSTTTHSAKISSCDVWEKRESGCDNSDRRFRIRSYLSIGKRPLMFVKFDYTCHDVHPKMMSHYPWRTLHLPFVSLSSSSWNFLMSPRIITSHRV